MFHRSILSRPHVPATRTTASEPGDQRRLPVGGDPLALWGSRALPRRRDTQMMYEAAQEFLPDEHIRELAKCDDLEAVAYLAFTVDTSENSLGELGRQVPNLRELRLNGSNISTLRDLGTGLAKLRVLWLARSGLRLLEGIGAFSALTELYLAFNEVQDLSPLMEADRLQVLDLEANAVTDLAQIAYLSGCAELHALTLEGNPIAEGAGYRAQVKQALPQLELLDDLALGDAAGPASRTATAATAAAATAAGDVDNADASDEGACAGWASSADGADLSYLLSQLDRRELQLVRNGIKYADALRAYDVESRVALAMEHDMTVLGGWGDAGGSRGTSSRGSSRGGDGSESPRTGNRSLFKGIQRPQSATTEGTGSTTPGGSARSWGGSSSGHRVSSALSTDPPDSSTGRERRPSSASASRPASAASASRGLTTAGVSRPSSARRGVHSGVHSAAPGRPGTAGSRLNTASSRLTTAGSRLTTAGSRGSGGGEDESSLLTHGDGVLVCGNPTQALRAKRRAAVDAQIAGQLEAAAAAEGCTPSSSADGRGAPPSAETSVKTSVSDAQIVEEEALELLDELRRFKLRSAVEGTVPLDSSSDEDFLPPPPPMAPSDASRSRARRQGGGAVREGRHDGRGTPVGTADEGVLLDEGGGEGDILLLDVESASAPRTRNH